MRVLGIDPGLTRCGVGVVEGVPGRPCTLIGYYVVYTAESATKSRTHVLTSHRHLPEALVLHADRCCNHGGEELGFYTATQARNLLATDEPMIVPCTCMLTVTAVPLAGVAA